jgi:hypothetical protein
MRCPQVGDEFAGVDFNSLRGEILTDTRHIPLEDRPRGRVRLRMYDLGEIYQRNVAIPVEDVVGRQIAVDPLILEKQVNVKDDAVKQWMCFVGVERHRVEGRRGEIQVSHISHQDGVLLHRVRLGDIRSCCVENLQCLEFVGDPRLVTQTFAVIRTFLHGVEIAIVVNDMTRGIEVDTSRAVLLVILEVTQHAWTIDLRSDKLAACCLTTAAQIDRGLLAAFESAQDIGDPLMFIEFAERLEQPALFETCGFVSEIEAAAGVILAFKKLGAACTDNLEVPLGEALSALAFVQEIIYLFVIIKIFKEIDVVIIIHTY